MRNPKQYVQEMADEVLPSTLPHLDPVSVAYNDQLHVDVRRMAKSVGMDAESTTYKAAMLLASDILDHLAGCLEESSEEDKEIGSYFISEASYRLRLLTLWGEQPCKTDCLDLRRL